MAKPSRTLDPRSDRVALVYAGDDSGTPALSGVPARSLTEGDLCRILYINGGSADQLVADLIASGIYTALTGD